MRVGLVLAAGQSRRFGAEDKLLASLNGRPLCSYAFETVAALELDRCFACVRSDVVAGLAQAAGLEVLRVEGQPQQSDSLRRGLKAAQDCGATQVLVTLADMPFVPATHMANLFEMAGYDAAASSFDTHRLPPAVFPASRFAELLALTGDQGAGRVIQALPEPQILTLPEKALWDIDTAADLERVDRELKCLKTTPE
ncbi:nucleotidyltransferase family protein [Celeribacter sp.]|uniref:nucleotidyltransferase family protein n=1 Tax=Celeribacter sp. TaxID=1890673 RepID=UPI003A8FA24E